MRFSSRFPLLFLVLSIAGFLCAAFLFSGFLLYIFSQRDVISATTRELNSIEKEEQYYRGLKRVLADTQDDRANLFGFFVDPENFVPFIEEIEALGAHAGIQVTIESAETLESGSTLRLTLFTSGNFDDVVYFLSLLETFPPYVSFQRVWVAKETGGNITSRTWEGKFIVSFASI